MATRQVSKAKKSRINAGSNPPEARSATSTDAYLTENEYKLTVDNAVMHAVIRTDENGVVRQWSRGAECIFGYSRNEVFGCPITIIFTETDTKAAAHVQEMEAALQDGFAEDERWHVRQDKTLFWGSGTTTPAYDLHNRLIGFVKVVRDETPAKLAMERLAYVVRHDGLTGLPNRQMFHEALQSAIEDVNLSSQHIEVLFIDLDRFKHINDSLGHHVGDLFLKEVATRLTGAMRDNDLVARLSGDEFGIICRCTKEAAGVQLAEKLIAELSRPFKIDSVEIHAGASIGITSYPTDTDDPAQLLKNADLAMYAAKHGGRSTYRLYTEDLNRDAERRRTIQEALRSALTAGRLSLHYQPQIFLESGKIYGFEALLRWNNCSVSDITCSEIVAVAEETGLAIPLSEFTLREACTQAKVWQEQGFAVRIAVNISAAQLKHPAFLKTIDLILGQTGLPAAYLGLEINEHTLMENNQANNAILQSLKKQGIHLSVDDFGTGLSSMSSLQSFPVDVLKIDEVFTRQMPQNPHSVAIASAIIGLAHSLNLKVIAEGIESKEQLACLAALGCDYGQGFYIGPPVLASQVSL